MNATAFSPLLVDEALRLIPTKNCFATDVGGNSQPLPANRPILSTPEATTYHHRPRRKSAVARTGKNRQLCNAETDEPYQNWEEVSEYVLKVPASRDLGIIMDVVFNVVLGVYE